MAEPPTETRRKSKKTFTDNVNEVKDAVQHAVDKATERVQTANTGREILKQHGEPAKIILTAKKTALDACWYDTDAVIQAQESFEKLTKAAAELRRMAAVPDLKGVRGQEKLLALAESYEKRAAVHQTIVHNLAGGGTTNYASKPTMNAAETDAMGLVTAQAFVKQPLASASKTVDGLAAVVGGPVKTVSGAGNVTTVKTAKRASAEASAIQAALQGTNQPAAGENKETKESSEAAAAPVSQGDDKKADEAK